LFKKELFRLTNNLLLIHKKKEKGLKNKVNKLYEAENKPELKGFNLVSLSKEEKESIFNLVNNKE
jgi:hypothetical protein